ncbi:hypothetical protein JCM10212_006112 [Sporobolomyces blumeae]
MDTTVPAQTADLPTSAPEPVDGESPSAPKRSRPDEDEPNEAAPATSTTSPVIQGFRVPKQFKTKEEWTAKPSQMGILETNFLDTTFETDDAREYKETLLSLEGLIARTAYPHRQHVRQLLALCFFPLLFKPPVRQSAFAKTNLVSRMNEMAATTTNQPTLEPSRPDPFNLTQAKLRREARRCLDDVIKTNGVEVVCRGIRGYGMPRFPTSPPGLSDDPLAALSGNPESTSPSQPKRRKTRASMKPSSSNPNKKPPRDPNTDSEEDLSLSDSDDVLAVSAKRIGKVENLWEFLAGTTARVQRAWNRERPVLEGGWDVVRSLVEGWEDELDRKRPVEGQANPSKPISLLRYFRPSATSSNTREPSSRALDLAFWPFSDAANPVSRSKGTESKDASDSSSDDGDLLSSDTEAGGKGERGRGGEPEADFGDGMTLEDKREVGVRMICLIGESAVRGHLDGSTTLSEIVQRMKVLDLAAFESLSELLALCATPRSPFVSRLIVAYLESYSHSTATTASLELPTLASLDAPSLRLAAMAKLDIQASPRKRALAAQSSMLSNASFGSLSQETTAVGPSQASAPPSTQQVESLFWKTPAFTSPDLVVVLSKIPIEVPLPASVTSDTSYASSGARPPRSSASSTVDRSFARADKAAQCHLLLKHLLVARKSQDSVAEDGEDGEAGDGQGQGEEGVDVVERLRSILTDVEKIVEQAKARS